MNDQVFDYPFSQTQALEPPAELAELRQKCPVARIRLPTGDEARMVTRYADVKHVLTDAGFVLHREASDPARVAEEGSLFGSDLMNTLESSGERYQYWRRMLSRWFTVKRLAEIRPLVEAKAEQLIDEMVEDGAPADLKAHLAVPLPVWVICEILGVPHADRDQFSYWSATLLSTTRYTAEEIRTAQTAFTEYMAGHVAAKRAAPGDDFLSALITEQADLLSDAELIAIGQILLVAGHESTANMIGKTTVMLLADRTRWERLLADPSLVRPAIEEMMRMDTNAGFGALRHVDQDAEIAGTTVPRGTTLVCGLAAANRDETVFPNPDEMDFERSPNPHMAFGAGPHSCAGQPLARAELQIALEVLQRKLPTLELAVPNEELKPLEGLLVGGFVEVPVKW
ncbi:cytochrome P450 [Streptomyces olindensis]|uniref:cytochrome P450 n=1 Tax=Streptomyces olindensis TaxID=358823 RepID=UPI0036A1AE2E